MFLQSYIVKSCKVPGIGTGHKDEACSFYKPVYKG